MKIREALTEAEKRLQNAGVTDARLDAEYLLAEAMKTPRLSLLIEKERALPMETQAVFEKLLSRREKREPLQYILGTQPFMGFELQVDARALIPRNDTEALCERALEMLPPGGKVLDLCTGTGALAIAIKKLRPDAAVTASDVSPDALSLARENAEHLKADVRFLQGDLFAPAAGEAFDLIVSNPPYIPDALRGTLQAEVEKEPALALFGGLDGLDFYRRIAREAPHHLRENGWLLLEIGDGQQENVMQLLQEAFASVACFQDLNGLPRVVQGQKKG